VRLLHQGPWRGHVGRPGRAVLYLHRRRRHGRPFEASPVAVTTSLRPGAPVPVIEYSDFQCPFCAEYAPWLATLREEYGDQVQFVFRFFPLDNHANGMISAQAAYAAYEQDKFWEMHDLLFERQDEWAESSDPGRSSTPTREPRPRPGPVPRRRRRAVHPRLHQESGGARTGVTHTPWFVIGDESVLPRSLEEFDKAIQERL
jgi:protein-disulfide isomerase